MLHVLFPIVAAVLISINLTQSDSLKSMALMLLFNCMYRSSGKSIDQKEIKEQEMLTKGTGTFPLERLLAIFQCITSVAEVSLDEEQDGNLEFRVEDGVSGLMSDVLLQLSSLCNANFISKGGSCPLEGSTRYRSTVSENLALKVTFQSFVSKVLQIIFLGIINSKLFYFLYFVIKQFWLGMIFR